MSRRKKVATDMRTMLAQKCEVCGEIFYEQPAITPDRKMTCQACEFVRQMSAFMSEDTDGKEERD